MKEVDKLKELNKRLVQKLKVIKMGGKKGVRKIQKMVKLLVLKTIIFEIQVVKWMKCKKSL